MRTFFTLFFLAIAPAAAQCPNDADGIRVEGQRLVVSGPIVFDLYAGTIDAAGLARVDAVARRMRACPDLKIAITVHTDSMRVQEFNRVRSQVIADLIRSRLIAAGIAAARIAACGMGEGHPIADNQTAAGRQTNNRIEWNRFAGDAPACAP
jgi:OmpA-OmpF porin, OOP family